MSGLGAALRFVSVGVLSLVVDVGALWILHGGLGVPLVEATALAYLAAFFVNFFVNRAWTFRSPVSGRLTLLRYAALVAVNLLAVEVGVVSLVALGIDYRIARALCTALLVPVNFVVMRTWVFRVRAVAPRLPQLDG